MLRGSRLLKAAFYSVFFDLEEAVAWVIGMTAENAFCFFRFLVYEFFKTHIHPTFAPPYRKTKRNPQERDLLKHIKVGSASSSK